MREIDLAGEVTGRVTETIAVKLWGEGGHN